MAIISAWPMTSLTTSDGLAKLKITIRRWWLRLRNLRVHVVQRRLVSQRGPPFERGDFPAVNATTPFPSFSITDPDSHVDPQHAKKKKKKDPKHHTEQTTTDR